MRVQSIKRCYCRGISAVRLCSCCFLLAPIKKKKKRKTQPRLFPSLDVFKLRVLTRKLSDERTTRSSPSERCLHAPSFLASLVLMLPTRRPPPPPPFPTAHAPLLPPARSLTSQAQSRCDYVTGQLRAASLFCLCVYLFFLFFIFTFAKILKMQIHSDLLSHMVFTQRISFHEI